MTTANKLSLFNRRFAERVAAGEVPTQVMRDLKPTLARPDVSASKVMALPVVQEYIAQLEEDAMRDAGVTRVAIIKDIVRVKERCLQHEAVLDDDGKPIGEYQFREHGALKALEMLAKFKRLYEREDVLTINGPVQINIVKYGRDNPSA